MIKAIGHLIGLFPLGYLIFLSLVGLGANPIERLTHETGSWGLILLLGSLAITPFVKVVSFKKVMIWRKYFGLYAFFYIALHFLIYLFLDLSFDFQFLWDDIKDRPYITIGFLAFLILIPLAITSLLVIRRRMGRRWITLHKTVFLVNALALLHFYWLIRADYSEFWLYFFIFLALIIIRFYFYCLKASKGRV